MSTLKATRIATISVSLLLLGNAVAAQTRSEITGTITDSSGGVLPGVTVTVESPNLVGGPQVTVTNAEGTYRLNELTPGIYQLTAQLQGFQTVRRTELRVLFGTTLTMDLMLPVATIEQLITVSGAAPAVDVKTTAATTTMDRELLQNLPFSNDKRLVANVIELAPGSYSRAAFGAVRDANALMLDGFNMNFASLRGVAHDWIDEVQFVSLGAHAEYGEFTGTATNFTLRSGANQYSGLFNYWTSPNEWVGDNRGGLSNALREQFRPLKVLANWDLTAQGGAPIVRDRLFVFAGLNYVRRRLIPFAGGQQPFDDRWPRALAKVNWAATQKIKVEAFVTPSSRRSAGGTGFDPLRVDRRTETANVLENPATIWNGRMTSAVNDRLLIEVRQGGLINTQRLNPTPPNTRSGPAPRMDQLTGITSVNSPTFSDSRSTRKAIAGSVTRYASGIGGEHALKFGGELEQTTDRSESGIPGGQLFLDISGTANQVALFDGSVVESRGRRVTFYAQDDWTIGNHLTLQAGVRMAANRGTVPDKGTVFTTNPVSPRVGIAWDVAADHRTVARAHYGRLHEGLLAGMYQFMHTAGQSPRITAAVLGPDRFVELNRFTPQGNFGIDSNTRQPYIDQYLVGIERELLREFSLQVQYVRRDSHDILAFVDTRSGYEAVLRPDPGADGILNTSDDAGLITVYNLLNPGEGFRLLTNPPSAFRRYNALQLVALKRYSRNWQFQGSYTWARMRANVNNDQGEAAPSGADTGQTGVFADPNRAINAVGRPQYDFPHQVKLAGTYTVPLWGGINTSAVYVGASGLAIGRTAVIRGLAQGNATVRIEPRGTRRTQGIHQVDLRVEKTWPLGAAGRTAGVYVDVLNANNYGTPIIRFSNPVIETSGASFLLPRSWIDPRIVQAGLRVSF